MNFISMDLEWNNAYVPSEERLMNIAIAVGAVKMDEDFNIIDTFFTYIRPAHRYKLRNDVKTLTGITPEMLNGGITYKNTVKALCKFVEPDDILLFWGGSDMAVLIENCHAYLHTDKVPFVNQFIDIMAYCNTKLKIPKNHQLSLTAIAEKLGVNIDNINAHDALDDSLMAAGCLQAIEDKSDLMSKLVICDDEYYARRNFRKRKITNPSDPLITSELMTVNCPVCHTPLIRKDSFRVNNYNIFAKHHCTSCKKDYFVGFVFTETYDGVKRYMTIRSWKNPENKNEE